MSEKSTTLITEILSDIKIIEDDESLYKETNFDRRAYAIDFIEFHVIDRIETLVAAAEHQKDLEDLKVHAQKVKAALEEIDHTLFEHIREKIRSGALRGAAFRKIVQRYLGHYISDDPSLQSAGYDNLDIFINGILYHQPLPEPTKPLQPEMVFYQKTPARVVFDMADKAELRPGDVFFDIGSGLGQVVILTNLISNALAKGVEYEPAYCNYAVACADQLNLPEVELINSEAQIADYSKGTVFFMYTPFQGKMMDDVLNALKKRSKKKIIKVFTYGPCSVQVSAQRWLKRISGDTEDAYALCEFRSILN